MLQTCENCGNVYDKAFTVVMNGKEHVFDCFECAINKTAPHCINCNSVIIGHGIEANNQFYCSGHCAKKQGYLAIDRVAQST